MTIDGLIDTGALSSAIPELDLRKSLLLSPQSVIREGPPPNFLIKVANGQLETPKSPIELKFEDGDIEFHESFIVMEHLTRPIIGLMFFQRNHTVLDMRQGNLNFPFFSMQLKTASEAARNEHSDWPDSAGYHKNREKSLPDLSERQETDEHFSEETSPNEIDAQDSPKRGDDFIVPGISQSDNRNENLSPRGGRYNHRHNPNPNYSEDFRYYEKIKLRPRRDAAFFSSFPFHFLGPSSFCFYFSFFYFSFYCIYFLSFFDICLLITHEGFSDLLPF